MKGVSKMAAATGGIAALAVGVWAFADPSSFYDRVASFPPYNRHFIHDIGAFQAGIGVTLLLALRWKDALLVALSGTAAGATLHFAGHVEDRNLGGSASDSILLGVLALVLFAGAIARARSGPDGRGGE